MKKNKIVVTGGAGFVGTNLINLFLKKTKYRIISIDNYTTGLKKNHNKNKRVKYIKGDTKNISKILKNPKTINSIFHFGEFARIYQSFINMNECINSNSIGTNAVFNYCLKNKIKLIYSATSASLGNKGNDKNLSPYAFTKARNLELLENLKRWFNFKYEVIYFYNVYGTHQICKGIMATVIGILLLDQVIKQEDSHTFMIPSKFVIRLGKKIYVDITVLQIIKVIQYYKLLKCLEKKLNFYLVDLAKDMLQL